MRIKQGKPAPVFHTKDYLGNPIDLSSYKGKKVLLSFFRGASCPFCNLRVHQMIQQYPELKSKQLEQIVVFSADREEIQKYAGKQHPPFPVIPDPEGSLYKIYGIESSIGGMLKAMLRVRTMLNTMTGGFFNFKSITDSPILPADFAINENGNIYKAYYGSDYGDHIDMDEVMDWLKH